MTFKKAAFTLSEVLITMTIVGAVAALTIPTLHYQRIKKEYTAKLKNFYSKMNNAILDMELDKGSFRDMKLPTQGKGYDWYIENIDPYLGHAYVNDDKKEVYYKDGSKLTTFYTGGCLDVIYDVNGDKSPNQEGYDRYRFLYCFSDGQLNSDGTCKQPLQDGRCYYFGNKDIFFGTYGGGLAGAGVSRETMITKCQTDRSWCTRLLQNDQWEFKGDYPFKF